MVVSYRNSTSNHNSAFVIESVTPLYLIEILHQTTTALLTLSLVVQLYLIEILHQTTTVQIRNDKGEGCILSKFYIKPQHVLDSYAARYGCILSKFYIKPQRSLRSIAMTLRCILSKFYIKPQRSEQPYFLCFRCILSKFYIKPQQRVRHTLGHSCCILSKFYIKPQQRSPPMEVSAVVSYRNSTSNHNNNFGGDSSMGVVSYRNSTSNHNVWLAKATHKRLYLIEILHQTTTKKHTR